MRKSKKGDPQLTIEQALDDARSRVLDRVQKAGTVATVRYKLQTIARYKELHNNRHPKEDGLTPFTKTLEGADVEVVSVRVTAQGEWDYDHKQSDMSELRDKLDDGSNIVRAFAPRVC